MASTKSHYCEKCKQMLKPENFYKSNNLEKYPDNGLMNMCKKCMTMHVDSWDPKTYLWILQEADVPYVADEWNGLLWRYGQDPSKVSGTTIIGRYLGKMRMKQFKDYRWSDSDNLLKLKQEKMKAAMRASGYDDATIQLEIEKSIINAPPKVATMPEEVAQSEPDDVHQAQSAPPPPEAAVDYFDDGAEDELVAELTDEDKKFLRLKWGKAYQPNEWIALEKLYNEMIESYDITSAAHIDTLKLICKTSLKANQLIDLGD